MDVRTIHSLPSFGVIAVTYFDLEDLIWVATCDRRGLATHGATRADALAELHVALSACPEAASWLWISRNWPSPAAH